MATLQSPGVGLSIWFQCRLWLTGSATLDKDDTLLGLLFIWNMKEWNEMFSEGPLEFSESINCKMLPISQKEKKMVKEHLLFTKEKANQMPRILSFPSPSILLVWPYNAWLGCYPNSTLVPLAFPLGTTNRISSPINPGTPDTNSRRQTCPHKPNMERYQYLSC